MKSWHGLKTDEIKGVRQALVPDFKLEWSGWTAFRSVFDASLVDSIPDLPEDSAH